jgi:AdoMet-dependent rRNA methyltransferase SPB1
MWRDKMRAERKAAAKADISSDEEESRADKNNAGELDSDAEDAQVQSEIEELRKKKTREAKRKKKKERELAAKRRQRAAFGMDLNAIDVPDNDKIFSLASISTAGDLEAAREVDLEKVTDDQLFPTVDSDEEGVVIGKKPDVGEKDDDVSDDEDAEFNYSLEAELDAAYNRYLTNTKDGMAKSGTKLAKRTKKLQKQKALEEAQQDAEMVSTNPEGLSSDAKKYAEMLQGARDSDDESSDDDSTVDDGKVKDFSDKIMKPDASEDDSDSSAEEANETKPKKSSKKSKSQALADEPANPLIFKLAEEPTSVKTSRWFNLTNKSLFESIENTARSASFAADRLANEDDVQNFDSDEDDQPKKRRKKGRSEKTDDEDAPLDVDDIIASIPKTDKQKRHEKRLKSIERMERRNARREREAGMDGDFKVVSAANSDDDMSIDDANMSEAQKRKLKDARALIKAGMGDMKGKDDAGFEVVPSKELPLPAVDTRKYDSEEEDYDSDDYIKTLALGTMILRKSKEKAMVDASYNRYAWNDPEGLPDWFVDDENKNYRPQLPIPPELLEKMRQKVLHLSTKPIAKVAEARARKNKMARAKLAAAKKKAEAVANSSEMSETMKLKAISKAMRGKDASKPGKTYVVAKKGGKSKGGKGIKLVDKREKNDKRGLERAMKKKKNGKKGGLTGSKRRRNHK